MEIGEFTASVRRYWWVSLATFAVVAGLGAASTRLGTPGYTASATLLAAPQSNTVNVNVVQYLVSALPAQIESQTFHDAVMHTVAPPLSSEVVDFSATSDETTGLVSLSADSRSAAAVVPWAAAAAAELTRPGALPAPGVLTVRTLDLASAASVSSASTKATLAGAVGLAVILGILAGPAASSLRRRLRAEDRVAQQLGIPVLATVPKARRGASLHPLRLLSTNSPDPVSLEAIQTLAVNLLLTLRTHPSWRSLAVVSAQSGDGRSMVAANLAWALAGERRVVLIDGDYRTPGLPTMAGMAGDGIIDESPLPDLRVVVARSSGLHPAEQATREIPATLRSLDGDQSLVLVDTAGIDHAPESVMIAASVDAVIVVYDLRRQGIGDISRVVSRMHAVGVPVAGVVLNWAPRRRRRSVPRSAVGQLLATDLAATLDDFQSAATTE